MGAKQEKEARRNRQFDTYLKVRGECYKRVWEEGQALYYQSLHARLRGDWDEVTECMKAVLKLREDAITEFERRKPREDMDQKERISGMCCRPLDDYAGIAFSIPHQLSNPLKDEADFDRAFKEMQCWKKDETEWTRPLEPMEKLRTLRHCLALYLSGGVVGIANNDDLDIRMGVPTHPGGRWNSSMRISPEACNESVSIDISEPDGSCTAEMLMPWGETLGAWAWEHLDRLVMPPSDTRSDNMTRINHLSTGLSSDPATPWADLELRGLQKWFAENGHRLPDKPTPEAKQPNLFDNQDPDDEDEP